MKEKVEKTLAELRSSITKTFDDPRGGFTAAFVDQLYVGSGLLPECLAEAAVGGSSARTRALADKALLALGRKPVAAKKTTHADVSFADWKPGVYCGVNFDKLAKRLRHRSDWPYLVLLFDLGFPSRLETLASIAKDQTCGFETRKMALESLKEIRNICEQRGHHQDFKRVISDHALHAIKRGLTHCDECTGYADLQRCSCGCARHLCPPCCEIDDVTKMILKELAGNI